MKRPNWNDLYASMQTPHIAKFNPDPINPGIIGRGFIGDVTVYLEILKNQDNLIFEAVVTGFDPRDAKIPDLQITDKVEITIRNFLQGR